MTSTFDFLANAIKTQLDAVPDIGQTHNYQRFAFQMEHYLDLFHSTVGGIDQIRGWVLTLDSRDPIRAERDTFGVVHRIYNFLIFGVMSVSDADASEPVFLNLAQTVMDGIEGHLQFGVSGVYTVDAATMRVYELRMFGGTLCHYGEISVPIHVDLAALISGGVGP